MPLITPLRYFVSNLVTAWSLPKFAIAIKAAYDDLFHTRKGGTLGMAYYIYENWQAGPRKAVIHRGSCGYCNNGQGRNEGNYDPDHGEWHGPWDDLQEARKAQTKMSVKVRKECQICRP